MRILEDRIVALESEKSVRYSFAKAGLQKRVNEYGDSVDRSSSPAFQSMASAEKDPAEDGRSETNPEVVMVMAEAAINAEGGLRATVLLAEEDLLETIPVAHQGQFVDYSKIDNSVVVKVDEQEDSTIC